MANSELSGDVGFRIRSIMGADPVTFENLEKHFGDSSQWTEAQYDVGSGSSGFPLSSANSIFAANGFGNLTNSYAQFIANMPTIDGVQVFKHPDFQEYVKSLPLTGRPGSWYISNLNNWKGLRPSGVENSAAKVWGTMIPIAQQWIAGSKKISNSKLAEKVNAYQMDEEQQRRYADLSSSEPREDGLIYTDENGMYTISGNKRYSLEEGQLMQGAVDDAGVFKIIVDDSSGSVKSTGDVLAVVNNGTWKHEGLISGDTVQLSDGTKAKIPAHVGLAHDGTLNDGATGFYNGYLKITKDSAALPNLGSGYQVDNDGNILIKANEPLDFIVNSPVVRVQDGKGGMIEGYAGAGMQIFQDIYGDIYDVSTINLQTGEAFDGEVSSLSDFYYKNTNGRVNYLHNGRVKQMSANVGLNDSGNITWDGKEISDQNVAEFLNSDASGMFKTWSPVVYDNGQYDVELASGDWTYSKDNGWYYESSDVAVDDSDKAEGAQWRWYATSGGQDREAGAWFYTNNELLNNENGPRFSTEDGLGVYKGNDGWRTLSTDQLLDSDGSGSFEESELQNHYSEQQVTEGKSETNFNPIILEEQTPSKQEADNVAGANPTPVEEVPKADTSGPGDKEASYYVSQISAGKTLYNLYDDDGNFITQLAEQPTDVPSYQEKLSSWQNEGTQFDESFTGWGERYQQLDIANSEFEKQADGSLKLINPAFVGDPLEGDAAMQAAKADALKLARMAANAPGAEANLGQRMIEGAIDKLLGTEWNPMRWLRKLGGSEDVVNLTYAYQESLDAAVDESVRQQNLATYQGAGMLAGKPWLNPGGNIDEQTAPFLQRKYVWNEETQELDLNARYDPQFSDFIYNKGPDGLEGTADDFEQMWSPSWQLPWDMRYLEADWRNAYKETQQSLMDYYNKPINDTGSYDESGNFILGKLDGTPDQTAFEANEDEGMQALYDKGFYNDPNQTYTVLDENGDIDYYVDYKGNRIQDKPPTPAGGFKEYKQGLYDELADDMYTWGFGGPDDVNSLEGRNKQLNEANDYFRQVGDQLEELALNEKMKNKARFYNFASDTSPMAEARQNAFNNTSKAILYGGQGINPNMFAPVKNKEGMNFFGDKLADSDNPFEVSAGGNNFNIMDKDSMGKSAEQILTDKGFTPPTINEDNIFLKNRKKPTTTTP